MPSRSPDWNETFDVLRDIMIGLRMYMDSHEREVVMFIYARTQLYGKAWEYIPYDHFMEGVFHGDTGRIIASPLMMSRQSLRGALKTLKEKNLIEVVTSLHAANRYRIRLAEEVDKGHLEAYVRRHQPKLYAYIQRCITNSAKFIAPRHGRITYEDGLTEALDPVLGEPQGRAYLSPDPSTRQAPHNSTYNNSTNPNTAVRSAPSRPLRILSLRKKV